MGIKERLQRKITLTKLQFQSALIVTLLSTILLFKVWPLFRSDAMSLEWYAYLAMIAVASVPLFKKK